jgi:hypothetical protein
MIDVLAIFLFSLLIVYTVFRAIKLDKLIPWFSDNEPSIATPPKKEGRK